VIVYHMAKYLTDRLLVNPRDPRAAPARADD
jgi:hypothetical protein